MAKDPKDAFKELYAAYDRDELTKAGLAHLEGNLTQRARRHSRWLWISFAVAIIVTVWLGILAIIYLLERTTASAERFERQRQQRIEQIEER